MDKIIVFDNVSALGPFGLNTVNGSHPARRALNATNSKLNFSSCLTPFYKERLFIKFMCFLSVSHLQIVDTEVTSFILGYQSTTEKFPMAWLMLKHTNYC